MVSPVLVGAVAYDPKVVTIWDKIVAFYAEQGFPIDYVLYSNYERMADALEAGHIHIAWNSPLAWLDVQRRTDGGCRAIAMRDTDRDMFSYFIVRQESGIDGIAGLRGKVVATGASDSPQSTLIPLEFLHQHGLDPERDFTHKRYDLLVGKHGDHVGGELEAFRSVLRGESDACAILNFNWEAWQADPTIDTRGLKVLAQTSRFDHCNFTVLASFPKDVEKQWRDILFRMNDDPDSRPIMEMEGLREWLPGRVEGYGILEEAVTTQHFFDAPAKASA